MSTSGETLRWPQRARRSTIQRGVFARGSTLRDDATRKAPAQVRRLDLDRQLRIALDACLREARRLERRTGDRRDLARDAEHAQRMAEVGRELEGEDRVVELERGAHVGADDGIVIEDEQPFVIVATASARAPSTACRGSRRRGSCRPRSGTARLILPWRAAARRRRARTAPSSRRARSARRRRSRAARQSRRRPRRREADRRSDAARPTAPRRRRRR